MVKEKSKKKSSGLPLSHGVGRRKKAVARVWLDKQKQTSQSITINGRVLEDYFLVTPNRLESVLPFTLIPSTACYDVRINLHGGGIVSQSEAMKLGIARALLKLDESLRPELRKLGLLTVDARVKERQKYGQKGARAKFQFVKR